MKITSTVVDDCEYLFLRDLLTLTALSKGHRTR